VKSWVEDIKRLLVKALEILAAETEDSSSNPD
jgi:hypothetical protein